MTKLQIALTDQEADFLTFQAMNLGYSLTRFVKFLLGKEAMKVSEQIPVFQMSPAAIKRADEAWKEHKAGKTLLFESVEDLDKFIRNRS